ncbi:MAG: hypothetical protein IIC60_12860 [Proteobacteria bacterium]|nr:hypothetical protein [Pseudomonadota bacterium]
MRTHIVLKIDWLHPRWSIAVMFRAQVIVLLIHLSFLLVTGFSSLTSLKGLAS